MTQSESIKEIAGALSKFQSEMKPLSLDATVKVTPKDKSRGSYSFKYATFGNIINACREGLAKNGLAISQLVGEGGSVATILMHTSGEYLQSEITISGEKTPQGIGSAITYAKRYSYSSILGIVADQDDDANIAEGNKFETDENKADDKKWLDESEFNQYVGKIRDGKYLNMDADTFIANLRKHFAVNKKYEESLRTELNFQNKLTNGNDDTGLSDQTDAPEQE